MIGISIILLFITVILILFSLLLIQRLIIKTRGILSLWWKVFFFVALLFMIAKIIRVFFLTGYLMQGLLFEDIIELFIIILIIISLYKLEIVVDKIDHNKEKKAK